ncbi:hypothetical protein EVAR_66367_1 [Eumeta japonica]|uniref:Uncharacterized protein n=1 Tax=Eumeta variegata TaxID=151549 RepID=A0A4C1ZL69_EUMVA|nr:hypothetical protein EVAR_66367_1 [Eumeta japonica]
MTSRDRKQASNSRSSPMTPPYTCAVVTFVKLLLASRRPSRYAYGPSWYAAPVFAHADPKLQSAVSYMAPPPHHFTRKLRNVLSDPPGELTAEVERLININKDMSEVLAQTPPYYDLKRSSNRCAPRVPGTPIGDSARAKSPRDSLCRDAHLVAFIGQPRADGIPCRSVAIDEVLKAPFYWGHG